MKIEGFTMGCRVPKKRKKLEKLRGYFDVVDVVAEDRFQRLVVKDRVERGLIEEIVWFDLRLNYGSDRGISSIDIVESVCEEILALMPKIEDLRLPEELSSLEDRDDFTSEHDFWTLFDIERYEYKGIDFRKKLPDVSWLQKRYLEVIADAIEKGGGRFDEYWFDNPWDLLKKKAMSDSELYDLFSGIRLFLVERKGAEKIVFSNNFKKRWVREERFAFYIDNEEVHALATLDWDKSILPTYRHLIFTKEFLKKVREVFDVPYRSPLPFEDVLRHALFSYMERYEKIGVDWRAVAAESSSWEKFFKRMRQERKKRIDDFQCASSGFYRDGYRLKLNFFRDEVSIEKSFYCQYLDGEERKWNGKKEFDGTRRSEWVFGGERLYEEVFRLLGNQKRKQTTIFDFL